MSAPSAASLHPTESVYSLKGTGLDIVQRGAGTGSTNAPVFVKVSATVRKAATVTDAELMREALNTMAAMASGIIRVGRTRQCWFCGQGRWKHAPNCSWLSARAIAAKLEERLLKE